MENVQHVVCKPSKRIGSQGPADGNKQAHSLPSSLTVVPPYSGRSTLSPSFTLTGMGAPSCRLRRPGPVATTLPSLICGNTPKHTLEHLAAAEAFMQ